MQFTKIGKQLDKHLQKKIKEVLKHSASLFAWSVADMPDIDRNFICHKLSFFSEAKPIAQRRRKLGEGKRQAVKEESEKLIKVGFIREVKYSTWLSNIVIVKKSNGKWRMCVDYTDLNKACLKDVYSLPKIDRLVDGTYGYKILSFLDAYSGYNHIKMYPPGESKTAIVTEDVNYCYKVMPFGLKNVGATYKRLMDKVFREEY